VLYTVHELYMDNIYKSQKGSDIYKQYKDDRKSSRPPLCW